MNVSRIKKQWLAHRVAIYNVMYNTNSYANYATIHNVMHDANWYYRLCSRALPSFLGQLREAIMSMMISQRSSQKASGVPLATRSLAARQSLRNALQLRFEISHMHAVFAACSSVWSNSKWDSWSKNGYGTDAIMQGFPSGNVHVYVWGPCWVFYFLYITLHTYTRSIRVMPTTEATQRQT